MIVSINWIKDYVDLEGFDIKNLINKFTLSTAEVEDIYIKGDDVQNVVVGEILSVENHPESSKLHLLKVDTGDKIRSIVCGAPNVRVGLKVALACDGGRVPAGFIEKRKVAGFESEGMCCSENELGIGDNNKGIWELDTDAPNGTDIKTIYPVDDILFEVDNKSLTNRPDLWGHYGIAREFAALTGRTLKALDLAEVDYTGEDKVSVEIPRKDLVFRYSTVKMSGISRNESSMAMRIRLYYCGMRGINLLADVTNYIMLEIGQPTHAFNADSVDKIVVKTPESKINFTTLDGTQRVIDEDTLLICNGETPIGIAGIMGGLDSEIVQDTGSVVLESAVFDGINIRKSSQRLGLRTDASARYEKMLDPELTLIAVGRFIKLVKSLDSGAYVSSKLNDLYLKKYPQIVLEFNKKYVDRYTGIEIDDNRIINTLTSLGFGVDYTDGNFTVTVPSWRATKDVTIKADIIEEITRVYGYDNFSITTTSLPLKPVKNDYARMADDEAREILVKKYSMHEVHSYVWCDGRKFKKLGIDVEDNVRVINIENSDNGVLRNLMVPTLLTIANENKGFSSKFGIFEIGRIVNGTDKDGNCKEEKHLGIVLYDKSGDEKKLYFELLEIISCISAEIKNQKTVFTKISPRHNWQHPKNTASLSIDGTEYGFMCTLYPSNRSKFDKTGVVVCAEIDLNIFDTINAKAVSFEEPSDRQETYYDLSLALNNSTRFEDIEKCWQSLEIAEFKSANVIDTYDKLGFKGITVRLNFVAKDRTLEMEEVQSWIDKILINLSDIGVVLRS
ncbi:MAG: phenylalanine--tRNA ligase subunit beta [Clostridiales bacterium]|nr:phenylalanine--tRNA ligase subunit beta [Clostridiales bacterium]